MSSLSLARTLGVLLLSTFGIPALAVEYTIADFVKKACGAGPDCINPAELLTVTSRVSKEVGVAQPILLALAYSESRFRPKAANNENGLSAGIMQIQVRWHHKLFPSRAAYFDPYLNVKAGASILRECAKKHPDSDHRALMCYNGYNSSKYPGKIMRAHAAIMSTAEFSVADKYSRKQQGE